MKTQFSTSCLTEAERLCYLGLRGDGWRAEQGLVGCGVGLGGADAGGHVRAGGRSV